MSEARIEHINITVRDPDRAASIMEAVFGWTVRWSGPARDNGRSVHVGSASDYVSLYAPPGATLPDSLFAKGQPFNHVGVEVDDLDEIERRVVAAGLTPFAHGDYDPGRRFYFFDEDGIEFEVVSYR